MRSLSLGLQRTDDSHGQRTCLWWQIWNRITQMKIWEKKKSWGEIGWPYSNQTQQDRMLLMLPCAQGLHEFLRKHFMALGGDLRSSDSGFDKNPCKWNRKMLRNLLELCSTLVRNFKAKFQITNRKISCAFPWSSFRNEGQKNNHQTRARVHMAGFKLKYPSVFMQSLGSFFQTCLKIIDSRSTLHCFDLCEFRRFYSALLSTLNVSVDGCCLLFVGSWDLLLQCVFTESATVESLSLLTAYTVSNLLGFVLGWALRKCLHCKSLCSTFFLICTI